MKTYTSIILAALFLTAWASAATAQPHSGGQASATVEVTAKVVSAINVDVQQHLAFGKVKNHTRPQLDPAFQSNRDVGGGAQNGKAVISGAQGGRLKIDLDRSSYQMVNADNEAGPVFTPSLAGNSQDDRKEAGKLDANGPNRDVELGSEGKYYLYMGGDLGPIEQEAYEGGTDTYSTTVTVNVAYN